MAIRTPSSARPEPSKGISPPLSSSNSTTPSDHTSVGGPTEARSPVTVSGDMYPGVPTTAPVLVMRSSPSREANPKSATRTRPWSSTSRLSGFTSRWITPWAWA
jgi:hypothetical protein